MKDQHISSFGFLLQIFFNILVNVLNIAVAVGIDVISPAQSEDNIGVMLFAQFCIA